MARPSKYNQEFRERAARLVLEQREEYASESEAIKSIAAKLGIGSAETLRKWVRRAEIDSGARPGLTSAEHEQIKALKRENAELRRANEILKAAAGFLRGRARPARAQVIAFITEHKDHRVGDGLRWGVEPLCAVLTEHGIPISPSTYYEWVTRRPSARALRDEQVTELIRAERESSRLVAGLGSRKMWLRLRGKGHDVARCTVERLYRANGWEGAQYGRKPRTTIPDERAARAADLVNRDFDPVAPNRLWVADFTYVPTWLGMVYVAFVIDAFSRRVIGWRAATSMTTPLVLDALEHALFTRAQEGVTDLTGLVAHSDAGSQYTSIAFTTRLLEAGVDASVGSVGDAYDNALAESTIGSFKTEQINRNGPWRDVNHVEVATFEWVDFFNTQRPHDSLDDLTPAVVEQIYYAHRTPLAQAG
ncbi:IS3 family transposase [Salana multivorans]